MRIIGLLIAAAAIGFWTVPAQASRGIDQAAGFNRALDVAAQPAYQIEGGRQVQRRPWRRFRKVVKGMPRAKARDAAGAPAVQVGYPPSPAFEAAQASALGALLGFAGGWEDGLSAPRPVIVAGRRPAVLSGILFVAGKRYAFVSGGYGPSIPYNDYEISPNSRGTWGSRHGALDLTGTARSVIPDRQAGRDRLGIEIHAGGGRTEGCVGVEGWREAKAEIVGMIREFGRAFLHVWPGAVSVTPQKSIDRSIVVVADPPAQNKQAAEEPRDRPRHVRRRLRRYAGA